MRLALDYDNTYSADPEFWDGVAALAKQFGHEARIVTARDDRFDRTAPLVALEAKIPVIYTRGVAKGHLLLSDPDAGDFRPDWWADDKPASIIANSTTSREDLAKWRAERGEGPSIPRGCACGGSCACA